MLLREMMPRDAAGGGARQRMAPADIMAGDATDDGALDAALGVGGRGGGEGQGESGGGEGERAKHGRYSKRTSGGANAAFTTPFHRLRARRAALPLGRESELSDQPGKRTRRVGV